MFKRIVASALAVVTSMSMAAVDVNKASAADLDSIKGIGPGTSAKVLKAREQAAFKDWTDLIQRVGGIGPKKAAQLQRLVPRRFLLATPWAALQHLPRYL